MQFTAAEQMARRARERAALAQLQYRLRSKLQAAIEARRRHAAGTPLSDALDQLDAVPEGWTVAK